MDSGTLQRFGALSGLLGQDQARVMRILRAYRSAASEDLLQLDGAIRREDGWLIRKIAHRAAMACHLVGEDRAGRQLAAIAEAGGTTVIDPIMTQRIARARAALIDSIAWISAYIDSATAQNDDENVEEDRHV